MKFTRDDLDRHESPVGGNQIELRKLAVGIGNQVALRRADEVGEDMAAELPAVEPHERPEAGIRIGDDAVLAHDEAFEGRVGKLAHAPPRLTLVAAVERGECKSRTDQEKGDGRDRERHLGVREAVRRRRCRIRHNGETGHRDHVLRADREGQQGGAHGPLPPAPAGARHRERDAGEHAADCQGSEQKLFVPDDCAGDVP